MEEAVEEPREWAEFSRERPTDSSNVECVDGVEMGSLRDGSEPLGFQEGLRGWLAI